MSETLGQQAAKEIVQKLEEFGIVTFHASNVHAICHEIIDTLDAQRTPCCEIKNKCIKQLSITFPYCCETHDNSPITQVHSPDCWVFKALAAHPCSCQRTPIPNAVAQALIVQGMLGFDASTMPEVVVSKVQELLANQRTPASAGSEEEIADQLAEEICECVDNDPNGCARFNEGVARNLILAALRRSRVQSGVNERLAKAEKWLWIFASANDGESLYEALQREHGDKYEEAYGWEKEAKERGLPIGETSQPDAEQEDRK